MARAPSVMGEIAPPVLRGLQLATGHTDSARGLRLGGAGAGVTRDFTKRRRRMKFPHSKNCGHTCPCDRRPEWRICGRFRKAKGATGSGPKQHCLYNGRRAGMSTR